MGKLLFGTSGYSYKDWVGVLYPEGTRQADYLSLYAQEFDLAEFNFSYYKIARCRTFTADGDMYRQGCDTVLGEGTGRLNTGIPDTGLMERNTYIVIQ